MDPVYSPGLVQVRSEVLDLGGTGLRPCTRPTYINLRVVHVEQVQVREVVVDLQLYMY